MFSPKRALTRTIHALIINEMPGFPVFTRRQGVPTIPARLVADNYYTYRETNRIITGIPVRGNPWKKPTWIIGKIQCRLLHENSVLYAGQVPFEMYSRCITAFFPNCYLLHGRTPAVIRNSAALLKPDARNGSNVARFFRFSEYFLVSDVKYLKNLLIINHILLYAMAPHNKPEG